MFRTSFLLLAVFFAQHVTAYRRFNAARVIGGQPAPPGKFPYIVSLRIYEGHICGGSILNDRWIVTAAHCCKADDGSYIPLTYVVTNTTNLDGGGDFYQVNQIIDHPYYYYVEWRHDICLVQTSRPIIFGPAVQPIQVSMNNPRVGERGVAAGWGIATPEALERTGVSSKSLQFFNINVVDLEECKLTYNNIYTEDYVCTIGASGTGICSGDSGGPVVTDDGLIGVISRRASRDCANGAPDIEVLVKNYMEWINQITSI